MRYAPASSGGAGSRFGAGVPKQRVQLSGQPMIVHILELLERRDVVHQEFDLREDR